MTLKPGKLPNHLLAGLLRRALSGKDDARLLVGPGVGEDAAQIDFGAITLIAKTDPITFATDEIGWYAVNVNANDIAATGGTPKWFLATLLMPVGSTESDVAEIFEQLSAAASAIDVALAGGHTEITPAVTQPVVCGIMLGEAEAGQTLSNSGAEPGNTLILTKGIAIEGTAILARERREHLIDAGVSKDAVERAALLLREPGMSVLEDARTLLRSGGVHAMHDITEGGLATAAAEMAVAANCDVAIDPSAIHVLPETAEVCDALDLDPWGLISSGALLAAVDPSLADSAVAALRDVGIAAGVVGAFTEPQEVTAPAVRVKLDGGGYGPAKTFERDELARYFESLEGG